MKKFRQRILEMQEGFLTGKSDKAYPAYMFANLIFISVIHLIIYIISAIICETINKGVGICMIAINIISLFVFVLWDRAFSTTILFSYIIFAKLFGRYGLVVRKEDWKRIKKTNKEAYKFIWDKKNIGHCYAVAWVLALHLKDAKVMYCSIEGEDGQTAHAVVVKNDCIYDTNIRRHYDFDEYIRCKKAYVYKIFEENVYRRENFFDDVRQGFIDWCAERNVYCDPQ